MSLLMFFRGLVDFESSYMEVFSWASGWYYVSCMDFVFGR